MSENIIQVKSFEFAVENYLPAKSTQKLIEKCEELLKILTAIIKSIENKINASK